MTRCVLSSDQVQGTFLRPPQKKHRGDMSIGISPEMCRNILGLFVVRVFVPGCLVACHYVGLGVHTGLQSFQESSKGLFEHHGF